MKIILDEIVKPTKQIPWDYEVYSIIDDNNNEVGHIVYRLGTSEEIQYCGHIGYTIDEEYRGHGYARKACQLLFENLRDRGVTWVYISCNVDNIASQKTIEHFPILNKRYVEGNIDMGWDTIYIYEIAIK